MRRLASVSVTCIALLAMLAPPVVGASPITVDCKSDAAALKSAVAAAPSGSRLVILGTCIGVLDIDRDVTITAGTPDARLTGDPDSASGEARVLRVDVGATVRITHLTIIGGSPTPGVVSLLNYGTLTLLDSEVTSGPINAIRNFGTLTLRHSTVTENRGMGDAPIDNRGGTVTLIESTVSDNSNSEISGAIANRSGTVTLIQSTVSGNNGFFQVIINAGTMTFRDSTVADNQSLWAAVINYGTMSFAGSVVSGNLGRGGGSICGPCGGGIHNAGTLLLRDSIVRANVTNGDGGGIYNVGTATLRGSQVASNTASGDGGGVFNLGSITLRDATITDNTPNDCVGC
jgi:hypothetical protein